MIIKYIKEKPKKNGRFIPIGRTVECGKEHGLLEIELGFAELAEPDFHKKVQDARIAKAEVAQEEIVTKKSKK